jgi:hypothetical protein
MMSLVQLRHVTPVMITMTQTIDSTLAANSSSDTSNTAPLSSPPAVARVTPEQLEAAAAVTAHAFAPEPVSQPEGEREYDRLRRQLEELWSAPVRDMAAIDATMVQLDEAHASFKAQHATDDHQRY